MPQAMDGQVETATAIVVLHVIIVLIFRYKNSSRLERSIHEVITEEFRMSFLLFDVHLPKVFDGVESEFKIVSIFSYLPITIFVISLNNNLYIYFIFRETYL